MKADLDCQRQRQRQLPRVGAPFRRKLLAVLLAACYGGAQAAPVNPTVVAGQAGFNLQGKTYSITNTPNTIINWQGFSLGADEVARFIQQSADSKVLNRITGQDPSVILGALQSNGKVFLINPNGVLFGAGSRVDVNGLVASSLAISNPDFLGGRNNFSGGSDAGKVVNQGTITTPAGGRIFLIAPAVENSGVISSPNGDVVLAAGHSVQLFDSSDPNVQVVVSSPADQALNLGSIVAQGGRVGVYGALVTQRGGINADSAVMGANGKIILKSSRTTLLEAGSVTSARGTADGNLNTGGDIVLLGAQVGLTGNAVIDASGGAGGGTVLVGGDYQGRGDGKTAAVPNAQQTYVGKDSVIKADATGLGDGGKVIVWSDRTTRVFGTISARGGAAGGNGGLVETSGHYLDMQGKVDTRAPLGATGTLLLDPSDIYIASDSDTATAAGMAGATSSNNGVTFLETTAVADSLLLTSTLEDALGTTDVTVTTANSAGTGGGKISVLSSVTWSTANSLTLNADAGIELKASINGVNAPLRLNAGGAIVQTTSPIDGLHAASLGALAANDIVLDNGGNTIAGVATLNSTNGNASLTAASINLGDSSVAGTLSLTASGVGGLTQTGGGIYTDDTLTVGNGGDIAIGNARAKAGIMLNAAHGGITQTGALVTDSLHAYAAKGVTLTDSGNHIGAAEAIVNGGGNIALKNTVSDGELALGVMSTGGNIVIDNTGGVHTTGDIAGAGGLVSITAHSPITVNHEISAANIVLDASTDIRLGNTSALNAGTAIDLNAGGNIVLGGRLRVPSTGRIAGTAATGNITSLEGTAIDSNGGPVTLTSVRGAIDVPSYIFIGQTVATLNDGSAAAAAADAAAKAAADAAAKAAADAAAKAAADAAAQAAADAAAQAAVKAAAAAAAQAAAEAAVKAAADAAAQAAVKAAADAAAQAAAEAAVKAAADAAAEAAAKAAADAAAKAAADAAAQAAAQAAAKAAADAAAQAAAGAAADANAQAAAKAAADAAAQAAADAAAKAAADAAIKAAADAAAKAAADAAAQAAAAAAAKAATDAAAAATQARPGEPIGQALNATVNLINTVTPTTSKAGGAAQSEAGSSETKNGGKAPDKQLAARDDDGGTGAGKAGAAPKKMYCN